MGVKPVLFSTRSYHHGAQGDYKLRSGERIKVTLAPNPSHLEFVNPVVAGMTRALARELGSRNITVNCVAPGFIETDMTRALSADQTAGLLGQIPLGRLGAPADIAYAVAFLASDQAEYVTGTTLHVNGGMYMS